MSQLIKIDDEYAAWVREICVRFRQSQVKAAMQVNAEMLAFYWSLGKDLVTLNAESRWGSKLFQNLSTDLKSVLPGIKGLSITNLGYMKRFYLLYSKALEIHPQVGGELETEAESRLKSLIFAVPWGHHKYIIDKYYNDLNRALFYVRQTFENSWSRNVLLNFMDSDLYERQGKAISNFQKVLPAPQGDLAQEMTRDPYKLDFLTMTNGFQEKELKDALTENITKFLLELGTGFAYVGKEFRLQVGETELFLDLLFYNLNLRCYVVVEIKTGDFHSENVGQLGTYVAAVNHLLKKEYDQPTLGILICKNKNNVLAQYALESSSQPIGISEYELAKLYPENFKSSIPTIEELEQGLK